MFVCKELRIVCHSAYGHQRDSVEILMTGVRFFFSLKFIFSFCVCRFG